MSVGIELINKTLILKNTGNIPYNKSVFLKLGNESIIIDALIDVDKSQKYIIDAPDG